MAMAVAASVAPRAVVSIRSVYCEDETQRFYRVVYSGLGQGFTYLANLEGSRIDIRVHPTEEFRRLAAPGYKGEDRLVRCDDPYDPSRMLVCKSPGHDIQSKLNWDRFKSIATEYLPDGSQLLLKVLNRSTRRRYLSEAAEKAGVRPRVLYQLLRLYLQRGMTPSAVASGYANCGHLITNALYNAANDESGILKNEPVERKYERRPGRPPRRSKYRYALPSVLLNRLMWQYTDIYNTWKEGPWFLDPDAKELGRKLLGSRRGKNNRFTPKRSAAMRANMRPRLKKEAKGRRSKPSQRDIVDGINFELRAEQVRWDEHGHIVELRLSDDNVVTERMFNHFWSKTRPSYRKRRRKHPAEEVNRRIEPELGRAWQHVKGPGDQFLIDSTVVDVYLISRYNRRVVVGRPTLYFIVDLWSCMIVGLHLSFDPPSKVGAALALDSMLTPKAEFCKRFGFDIADEQWPWR
jgi:putative transposase